MKEFINTQDNSQIAQVIIVEKRRCIRDNSFMIVEDNVLLDSIDVKSIDEKTGAVNIPIYQTSTYKH